jgi:hypothetical protein
MPNAHAMLAPVVALIAWSGLIWAWMYATRIPAMLKMHMALDSTLPQGQQMAQLPARVRWKADNYNHLMEQPTLFYAVCISLAVLGDQSTASVGLALGYVALRVAHSLLHALVNHIPTRFALFVLASLLLFALTYRAAVLVF